MDILIVEGRTKHVQYFDEKKLQLTVFRLFRLEEACEESIANLKKEEKRKSKLCQAMKNAKSFILMIGSQRKRM